MSVALSYNPLTQHVSRVPPSLLPHSLQYCCRKTIISRLGLHVHLVNELPLPSSIKGSLSRLSLSDFFIDADKIPPESHSSRAFPATCLLTDTQVVLRVVATEEEVNPVTPSFLASFEDSGQVFIVEQKVKTLADVISNCKSENIRLNDNLIRSSLLKLVNHIIAEQVPVTTHLSSESIIVYPNGQFSIQIATNDDQNAQNLMPGASNAVYEAPEVLNNDNPDSSALVWSTGCILHEAMALEPAFNDPSGTNPFQVYMNITNGVIPPTPSDGSEELQALLEKCLVHDRAGRVSLKDLKKALSKL